MLFLNWQAGRRGESRAGNSVNNEMKGETCNKNKIPNRIKCVGNNDLFTYP
jgi:hypothetical protein